MVNNPVRKIANASMGVLVALFGLATHARAWQVDGFRSGMTSAEAAAKLRAQGLNELARVPVMETGFRNITDLFSRRSDNDTHFLFCSDSLYEISKNYVGGLTAFAHEVQIESSTRGLAKTNIQENSGVGLVIARWQSDAEYFEMILESDLDQKPSFAKSYGDSSIKKNCAAAGQQ